MLKWDGHNHTKYCYHGSDAEQELYIERAIELGFQRYTITEHSPIPQGWLDDRELFSEMAMPLEQLPEYIDFLKRIKQQYDGKIEITAGLEMDYLQGRQDFTNSMLSQWQHELEDVVYSVHYLPGKGGMRSVDFTVADFTANIVEYYGTMEKVVNEYYDHVEQAIIEAGTLPMRKRIGHINLIEKFASELPSIDSAQINDRIKRLLPLLLEHQVGVDVNTAGMRVVTCGKAYVPPWFIILCKDAGVECVYGSDAHKPEQVGFGWDYFAQHMG